MSTRAEATRRHLLDVAADLFAGRGYEATSFADLIAASGLSKGAFYFHFPSKRDLALAVLADRQERLAQAVMARVDPSAGGMEQFRQLWLARAEILAADPSLRCLRKLGAAFSDDPDLAAGHAGPIQLMAAMLARAQAEGDVRADVDPERAARVAFDAAVGMDEVSDIETAGADLVDHAEAFLEVFRYGIAVR
jgi:AcrR family transcriptional regulator